MDRNKIENALMCAITNVTAAQLALSKCRFYTLTEMHQVSGEVTAKTVGEVAARLKVIRALNVDAGLQGGAIDFVKMLRGEIRQLTVVLLHIANYRNLHSADTTTFAIRRQIPIALDMATNSIESVIDEINTLA